MKKSCQGAIGMPLGKDYYIDGGNTQLFFVKICPLRELTIRFLFCHVLRLKAVIQSKKNPANMA